MNQVLKVVDQKWMLLDFSFLVQFLIFWEQVKHFVDPNRQ
jgi:hypothetical protein